MNTKIKALITSSLLLATAIPVIACARKAPETALPVPEPAVIDVKPTIDEATPETEVLKTPIQIPDAEPVKMQIETLVETQQAEQKAETKNTTKKTAKKTTKKTTKKATKKTKKNNKKSDKKTGTPKFTYGKSQYTYQNYTVYVNIKKDNTASIGIVHKVTKSDAKYQFCFNFSGKINPKTGLLVYNNGSKETIVEGVHVRQARMDYILKGSGYMTFNGNSLTWFDGVDHYADSVTFHKQ